MHNDTECAVATRRVAPSRPMALTNLFSPNSYDSSLNMHERFDDNKLYLAVDNNKPCHQLQIV